LSRFGLHLFDEKRYLISERIIGFSGLKEEENMIKTWTLWLGMMLLFTTGCDESGREGSDFEDDESSDANTKEDSNSEEDTKSNSDSDPRTDETGDADEDEDVDSNVDEESGSNSDSDADGDEDTDSDGNNDTDSGADNDLSTDTDNNSSSDLVIEEADGFCFVDGKVDTENSGYTGSGFANTSNASGAAVEWAVAADSDVTVTLEWLFANGGDAARPGTLIVNDTTIGTIDLAPTGDWSTWDTVQQELVALNAGNNAIRLEASTAGGLANIDSITVSGMGVTPGECSEAGGASDCNDIADQTIIEVAQDGSGSS
jgi:hypothetical protein